MQLVQLLLGFQAAIIVVCSCTALLTQPWKIYAYNFIY